MQKMSPRKCVEETLHRGQPEYIPFVIWDNKLPGGELEKKILDLGACVIVKSNVYTSTFKKTTCDVNTFHDSEGRKRRYTTYHTPYGALEEKALIESGSVWIEKPVFNSSKDYDAIRFLIEDTQHIPCYDTFVKDDMKYGTQGLARPATEKSPFYKIIYEIMGFMNFAVEWADNRHKVLELYEVLLEDRRKRLQIVAQSPAQYVVVDGNLAMDVIGKERFNNYYKPVIKEACDILHNYDKVVGVHLDGNNKALAKPFAELPVDMIESFTPPPDCDMSVSEALTAWPDKSLMVNFPSSVHLSGEKAVRETALQILAQVDKSKRVSIGIMENIPTNDFLELLVNTILNY